MDSPETHEELDVGPTSFHLGTFINTPAHSRLFVVNCCLDGNTSIVYKCVDEHNRVVALKTIRERFVVVMTGLNVLGHPSSSSLFKMN